MNEPTVKLASNAMSTLEDTMERLGIPSDAADTTVKNNIIRLITSASAWIETTTGRRFGKQTYTHRYAAPGQQELVLRQFPIRAVEYVKNTITGDVVNPESYDFLMTGDVGVLYRDEGWPFRGYVSGLAGDYIAPQRYLEVKYTAGYVLPKDATVEEPTGATTPSPLDATEATTEEPTGAAIPSPPSPSTPCSRGDAGAATLDVEAAAPEP